FLVNLWNHNPLTMAVISGKNMHFLTNQSMYVIIIIYVLKLEPLIYLQTPAIFGHLEGCR
ncbi:MAG: hypothetical protein WB502_09985, partial [Thermoactinomyces sp.]